MSNGIVIKDPNGVVLLDSTVITYSLLATIYCPANGTATLEITTNGLTPFAQVYLTDSFSITTTPTLATATISEVSGKTICTVGGGSVGCTVLVFAK